MNKINNLIFLQGKMCGTFCMCVPVSLHIKIVIHISVTYIVVLLLSFSLEFYSPSAAVITRVMFVVDCFC